MTSQCTFAQWQPVYAERGINNTVSRCGRHTFHHPATGILFVGKAWWQLIVPADVRRRGDGRRGGGGAASAGAVIPKGTSHDGGFTK
jgi:hypothetical protein